jgi:hypothetical protein
MVYRFADHRQLLTTYPLVLHDKGGQPTGVGQLRAS